MRKQSTLFYDDNSINNLKHQQDFCEFKTNKTNLFLMMKFID